MDPFFSVFLQVLLQNLLSKALTAILEELRLKDEIKEEFKSLTRDVTFLQAYLRDAAQKQHANEAVRLWLSNLQDVAYDANDLLDECAFELQRQKVIPLAQVRNSISLINPKRSLFLHEISSRVTSMKRKMEEIKMQRSYYGLQPEQEATIISGNESSSLEPLLVLGREDEESKIIDLLLSSGGVGESNTTVVCIFGAGGLGKTTLAQRVYNNNLVCQNFTLRSWVHVSDQDFMPDKLTKAILESIDGISQASVSLDKLQKELLNKLWGRKYLLVLDSVWIEDWSQWYKFRIPLLQGAMGSKILVTTGSVEVADNLGATIHRLLPLGDGDCWSLFFHYMVQQNPTIKFSDLESFSVEIAQECCGSPSTAADLAFRLCQEPDRSRWKSILQNKRVEFSYQNRGGSRSDLSYQLLPARLKPCFAFCSLFPKGYEFEKEELVKLWLAQNFIEHSDDRRMEDEGSRYFDFLERRSLFRYSHFDRKRNRSMYIIDESIHKSARYASRGDCIIAKPGQAVGKARHLSLMCQETATDLIGDILSDQSRGLCTLVVFGCSITELRDDFTKKLENLRALDLSNTRLQKLPNTIGCLKHLRCLQLRGTNIKRLPDSLCGLYFLQTLGLGNCDMLEELPKDLKYLQKLRHIDLHWDDDSMLIIAQGDISRSLMRRHRLKFMPQEIGLLINLQTLSRFVVGEKNGSGLGELENLNNLHGELLVSNLHLVQHAEEATVAKLEGKQHLQCLELHWADVGKETPSFLRRFRERDNVECILCELKPHSNLRGLRIVGFMGTFFPAWLGSLDLYNLTSLTLVNCRQCLSLPPLGNLPLLTELHVEGMDAVQNVNCAFCGQGKEMPFRALKTLHFVNMPKLKQWCGDRTCTLHSLHELVIRNCSMLEKITHAMPSLEKLVIEEAPRLAGLPNLPSLKSMDVTTSGELFWELFSSLTYIHSLRLRGLATTSLPAELKFGLNALQRLEISSCAELTSFPDTWPPRNLVYFGVKHCPKLRLLPNELKKLKVLEDIEIQSCPQLSALPEQVGQLKSLVRLDISDCPWILSLPSSLPNTLHVLSISSCPRLKEKYKPGDEDWPKIRDIFSVWIDGKMVISPIPHGESSGS